MTGLPFVSASSRPAELLNAAARLIPRSDAEYILEHILGKKRHELYSRATALPARVRQRFAALVARAKLGEPVQYVTGRAYFLDFSLRVDRRVLIPRPETEELVLRAAGRVGPNSGLGTRDSRGRGRRPLLFLDFGTGSGCIAIALARMFPAARVVAADVSPAALRVCRLNAKRLGVAGRVRTVQADRPDHPQLRFCRGRLSLLVSNPPYVPSDRIDKLDARVRDHEPRLALDGGPKGTSILAMLLEKGPEMLACGGLLALEIDSSHPRLLRKFGPLEIEKDLAGRPRYLFAKPKMSEAVTTNDQLPMTNGGPTMASERSRMSGVRPRRAR